MTPSKLIFLVILNFRRIIRSDTLYKQNKFDCPPASKNKPSGEKVMQVKDLKRKKKSILGKS